MDLSLQSDGEVTLQDVTNSTRVGRERRDALDINENAQDTLNREYDLPPAETADPGRTNDVIEGELDVLRNQHVPLQQAYDEWQDRLERGGDYLNYVLIHGTKLGTEANNYVRRLQRSTNGFEALRLMSLRYSGGQMLQNYQLLREKRKRQRKRRQRQERRRPLQRKRKEQRKRKVRRQQRKRKRIQQRRKRILPRMEFMESRRIQQQQRTRKRKRRKDRSYYTMPCLQKVWTRGSQLLVQGFYLHYSSCWFRYYWSDATLQHGPPCERPTSCPHA